MERRVAAVRGSRGEPARRQGCAGLGRALSRVLDPAPLTLGRHRRPGLILRAIVVPRPLLSAPRPVVAGVPANVSEPTALPTSPDGHGPTANAANRTLASEEPCRRDAFSPSAA